MGPRKARARYNHSQQHPQPSDYETDDPTYDIPPPPPSRTNEELNYSVIRRHYPEVTSILCIAQYAVVYIFSTSSGQWEKSGIEGTLFVSELNPSPIGAERFAAIILNRRGLDNFVAEITGNDNVQDTEEYVILQVAAEGGKETIYGLWIFTEPPPSTTAGKKAELAEKILECANRAEISRKMQEQALREATNGMQNAAEHAESEVDSVPMGRQLSLRELFGQQRVQDAGWSLHNHHSPASRSSQYPAVIPEQHQFGAIPSFGGPADADALNILFNKARQGYNGV